MAAAYDQQPPSSSFSFTQGFLLGQLTISLLIGAFIKFFIFGEPPPADERAELRLQARRQRLSTSTSSFHRRTASNSFAALRRKQSTVLRQPAQSLSPATILEKSYYNVAGHQPESLDWFNVLVAQTIAQLRADARQDDAVLGTLHTALNGASRPEWLDEIRISEVALGEEFPIFSNCRIIPVDDAIGDGYLGVPAQGAAGGAGLGGGRASTMRVGEATRLQARMDVDLSDAITLGIETRLVLNYPKPFSAVLPVALSVSVVRFSGTLSLSFVPSIQTSPSSPSTSTTPTSAHPHQQPTAQHHHESPQQPYHPPTSLTFTFLPDYRLDLSVRSLLGSRARLTDVPKIAQLIEDRIHAWFDERVVEPRFQQIVLPSLWPRKKTARGPDEDADADAAVYDDDEDDENDEGVDEGDDDEDAEEEKLYSSDDQTLEARLWRDGKRLRESEKRRKRRRRKHDPLWDRASKTTARTPTFEGSAMRRRAGTRGDGSRDSESYRMPGSLPM